eukprot:Skav205614  [mRNA]  locus=scaffold1292:44474:44794:+ [translate_table: standard]
MRFTLALLFPALVLAMRMDNDMGSMDNGPKPWQKEEKTKKKKKSKVPKDLKVFVQKGFDEATVEAAPKWVYQCRKATKDKSHTPISDWKERMSRTFDIERKDDLQG